MFDKYQSNSANDHERVRCGGIGSLKYDITSNTPLSNPDAILRNKHNKLELSKGLSGCSFWEGYTIERYHNGAFGHGEANITIACYVLMAADSDTQDIYILTDDTDIFVLMGYWVYKHQIKTRVLMRKWDGTLLDINATCAQLGPKCLQLLGMHYLTGCDTTSYFYGKGKVSALKTLKSG